MNGEETKIAKLINRYLLADNSLIDNLSKSCVSDFIKIDNTNYIRFFQSNLKLGVDSIVINKQENIQKLNTYLFNKRGYLESSYSMNIDTIFENDILKNYIKKGPDLESGSELEEIRSIALSSNLEYKTNLQKLILENNRKNRGISGFFRRLLKINSAPLELEQPIEKHFEFKDLVISIVNKQFDLIA